MCYQPCTDCDDCGMRATDYVSLARVLDPCPCCQWNHPVRVCLDCAEPPLQLDPPACSWCGKDATWTCTRCDKRICHECRTGYEQETQVHQHHPRPLCCACENQKEMEEKKREHKQEEIRAAWSRYSLRRKACCDWCQEKRESYTDASGIILCKECRDSAIEARENEL